MNYFKKVVALFLACCAIMLCSCNSNDNGSGNDQAGSTTEQAQALIESGSAKDAYFLLRSDAENPEAQAMLENFKVLHTKERVSAPDTVVGAGVIPEEHTYIYDEHGNVTEDRILFGKGWANRVTTTATEYVNGRISKQTTKDCCGTDEEFTSQIIEYNELGLVEQASLYNGFGELNYRTEYEYNKQGQLIKYTEYNQKTRLIFT